MKKLKSSSSKGKPKGSAVVGGSDKGKIKEWFDKHRGAGVSFMVVGIVVLAIVVPVAIYRSIAATGAVAFEAESGSLSSKVTSGSDSNASNGRFVQFSTGGGGGTVTLPNPGTWSNITGNLAGLSSTCGNLTFMSTVPSSDTVIAGVADRGLYAISGTSATWNHMGSGAGSAAVGNRPSWISYDPTNASIFYESGIYEGNAVYKTTNAGNTFAQLGNITHSDFVSVDYTDPNRQLLLAGGHEQMQTIYKSTNGGSTWTNIGTNLPSGLGFTTSPLIINSTTYVVNSLSSWGGGTPGIYRTTNGGTSWSKVSSENVWGPPLVASDGAIYWSDGDGLARSTDNGLTWAKVGSNLHYERAPIELPDGRIVATGFNNLQVSSNKGATFTSFGANLPYDPAGVAYSLARNAFYVWNWDCGNVVLSNAIMQLK